MCDHYRVEGHGDMHMCVCVLYVCWRRSYCPPVRGVSFEYLCVRVASIRSRSRGPESRAEPSGAGELWRLRELPDEA